MVLGFWLCTPIMLVGRMVRGQAGDVFTLFPAIGAGLEVMRVPPQKPILHRLRKVRD